MLIIQISVAEPITAKEIHPPQLQEEMGYCKGHQEDRNKVLGTTEEVVNSSDAGRGQKGV